MNKFLVTTLITANALCAFDTTNISWSEKEVIASDTDAPAEILLDIKHSTTNPFVINALNNNPKYLKLKENENKIKLLESRKLFENNIDEITNHFELINENLKKVLYVYKVNVEKERLIKAELKEKFKDMKDDFKSEYKKELDIINVNFKANLLRINSEIKRLNDELERRKTMFAEQLVNYVKIENKKMLFKTEEINKQTNMMKKEISEIVAYLKNIERTIFSVIRDISFNELKDTINPELLVIQNLYKTQIEKIKINIDKVFTKKTKMLFLLEIKTIDKAEKTRKLKILKTNKKLSIEKINKESQLKKEIIDTETTKKLEELEAKYQKESNILEVTINELNLKINEVLYVFEKINEEDKVLAHQLNQFKKLVETIKIAKNLVIQKDYQIDKERRIFTTSTERRVKIAKDFNTPIQILIKYSKNLDWRVREAVATNPHTPVEILKDLTTDENLFVSVSAKKTLELRMSRKAARRIIEENE